MDLNTLNPFVRRAAEKVFSAPYNIPARYLYDYDLVLTISGAADITIENETYNVRAGDAILIPPNIKNSFRVSNGSFHHFFVHFDPVYTPDSLIRRISFLSHKNMTSQHSKLIQKKHF